jgi:hypothetical protein
MLKIVLPLAVVLAMSTIPGPANAKVRHDYTGDKSYTVSLQVDPDCSLSLMTTGVVSFPAISAFGDSGVETTPNNPATIACRAHSAYMYVYDTHLGSSDSTYKLTTDHSPDVIPFKLCRDVRHCFYDSTSQSLAYFLGNNLNGQQIPVSIVGYLTGQGYNNPATYTDVITVALSFS